MNLVAAADAKNSAYVRQETAQTAPSTDDDDDDVLTQAQELLSEERYLSAAALLRQVDSTKLTTEHCRCITMAEACQAVLNDLLQPPDTTWLRQGETRRHPASIYYRFEPDFTCRIESPIPSSLLVPLLSVFNESHLYADWMPSWKRPPLGVRSSSTLAELGRGHQVIQIAVDTPFPLANRDCVLHAYAADAIEEHNCIIIKMQSLPETSHLIAVPPLPKGTRRVGVDAGMLIRACPANHPLRYKSKEPLLLLSLTEQLDADLAGIPTALIRFFTRSVIGAVWNTLLDVAEQVQKGRRPDHQTMIEQKKELYDWVQERVAVMLQNLP